MAVVTTSVDYARQLRHFIAITLMQAEDPETLGDEEPLLGSGILDSLGILRLVVFLEEEFGIAVPEAALVPEHFQTVRALVAFVERLQSTTLVSA
jgi:acyl carrier protein